MMPSLWLGLWATGLYVVLIAFAAVVVFRTGQPPQDVVETLWHLLPFQLLAALLCCLVVRRYYGWAKIGFARLDWAALIWFVPAWLVLGVMYRDLGQVLTLADLQVLGLGLVLLVVTPFLIAFAEEVMFRGVLLRAAQGAMPIVFALLFSAVTFGLMHFVNAIAGQGLGDTAQQVAFALMAGFFLAPIAIRLGNLWPLIIWHWLWNIAVFASQMADVVHPLALPGIAIQTVISIWLWADLIRDQAKA